jgi:hypothetical protein
MAVYVPDNSYGPEYTIEEFVDLITSGSLVDRTNKSSVLYESVLDCIIHTMMPPGDRLSRTQLQILNTFKNSTVGLVSGLSSWPMLGPSTTVRQFVIHYLDMMQSPAIQRLQTCTREDLIDLHADLFSSYFNPPSVSKPMSMECLVSFNHFIDCCTDIRRLDLSTTLTDTRRAYKDLFSSTYLHTYDERVLQSISSHLSTFLSETNERDEILLNCLALSTVYMHRLQTPDHLQVAIRRLIGCELRDLLYKEDETQQSSLSRQTLDIVPDLIENILTRMLRKSVA